MKKRIIACLIACVVGVSLIACSGNGGTSESGSSESETSSEEASEDKEVTLRLAYLPESGTTEDEAAIKFKEYVEKESGGSIKINLFPGGQLGSEQEMAEQCELGTTEMIAVGEVAAVNACPEYATIMRVPYIFDSYEHLDAYLQSEMGDTGKTIMDLCKERKNMKVLGYYDRGSRQLTANKAIKSVDDLKGLSLRVPEVAVQVEAWKETGAVPTAVEASELYLSLNQGLVTAQENPVDFIKGYALNEVQSYIMESNHNYGMRWIFINNDIYEGLSDKQKEVIDAGSEQYVETANELIHASEEETWKWLAENGMTIVPAEDIDTESIKGAIMEHIDELSADWDPCCLEVCEATRP